MTGTDFRPATGELSRSDRQNVVYAAAPETVGAAGDNVGVTNVAVGELVWGAVASPVGEISVACSAAGLAQVRYGPTPFQPGLAAGAPGGPPGPAGGHLRAALGQLTEYFAGQRRAFDLPVDWSGMSPAQRQVLPVLLATAGYGETVTYGELARRAGLADGSTTVPAARVAGQIMGSNPCPIAVPCHRVVASDGLGGYSGGTGIEVKRWLLIFEGALPPTLDWDASGPGVS
jgi:methylated-DNA-[protein]-cysteine S-methyltransferase